MLGGWVPHDEPCAVHLWAAAGDPAQLPGAHVLSRPRFHVQVHDDAHFERPAAHQDLVTYVPRRIYAAQKHGCFLCGKALLSRPKFPFFSLFGHGGGSLVPACSPLPPVNCACMRCRERRGSGVAVEGQQEGMGGLRLRAGARLYAAARSRCMKSISLSLCEFVTAPLVMQCPYATHTVRPSIDLEQSALLYRTGAQAQ